MIQTESRLGVADEFRSQRGFMYSCPRWYEKSMLPLVTKFGYSEKCDAKWSGKKGTVQKAVVVRTKKKSETGWIIYSF